MIIVDLTAQEALAYEQCGNIENEQQARELLTIKLVFEAQMGEGEAKGLAAQIAAAAQSARHKIAEATKFEIHVIESDAQENQGNGNG